MNHNAVDINRLYSEIEKLSLFNLKQMNQFIYNLLEDPERNLAAKRLLKPGMKISYFFATEQTMVDAIVVEIKNTRVTVQNILDHKKWHIYVSSINLEGRDTLISPKREPGKLDRNSLKIGDRVGFASNKLGEDLFGIIKKLNPKNAVVEVSAGGKWNVHYSFLFLITDGVSVDSNGCLLIECEVIKNEE